VQNKIKKIWIAHTKNQLHAVMHSAESIFIIEYLREYEVIYKKALTRVSGPKWSCLMKKTRGRKSRDRVPLSIEINSYSAEMPRAGWCMLADSQSPTENQKEDPTNMHY
jgi:hypothetical protein